MTSFEGYVINRLIEERKYEILAYIVVSRFDDFVEVLREAYPKEKEESLKEMAIRLKREAMDKLVHPLMNICPYCTSRKVENLDFEYECSECGRRFSRGWKDERFCKIVDSMYYYLKDLGMGDREIREYLFDVFGILMQSARNRGYHSEIDLLNLVSSTFLVLYDDPYFRNKFLEGSEFVKLEEGEPEETSRERIEEIRKEFEEAKVELDEEDRLVLSVLSKRRGLSYSEISKLTGLSYNRVKRIVKWLKRFGLVEVCRLGRRCLVVLK